VKNKTKKTQQRTIKVMGIELYSSMCMPKLTDAILRGCIENMRKLRILRKWHFHIFWRKYVVLALAKLTRVMPGCY